MEERGAKKKARNLCKYYRKRNKEIHGINALSIGRRRNKLHPQTSMLLMPSFSPLSPLPPDPPPQKKKILANKERILLSFSSRRDFSYLENISSGNLRKKCVVFMWYSNNMFLFEAGFVTLASLKVWSGCHQ